MITKAPIDVILMPNAFLAKINRRILQNASGTQTHCFYKGTCKQLESGEGTIAEVHSLATIVGDHRHIS